MPCHPTLQLSTLEPSILSQGHPLPDRSQRRAAVPSIPAPSHTTTGQEWVVWRGHSLFQDSQLFTLLKAQVSVVRGLIAVQGDNQVVCKDSGLSERTSLE